MAGDPIVVKSDGTVQRVRLLCVNTPESVHPDKKQNIPMGKVTSDYAKKRLSDRNVTLEFEKGNRRGNYGRLLAYVYIDGGNFNIELVRQGLSPYYTKYGFSQNHHPAFKAAEKTARKEKLHIWGDPELTEVKKGGRALLSGKREIKGIPSSRPPLCREDKPPENGGL